MSEIDVFGSFIIREHLQSTDYDFIVSANFNIKFIEPAGLGALVKLSSKIVKFGKTSFIVEIFAVEECKKGLSREIAKAEVAYVCMKDQKPHPHGITK